MEPTPDEPRDLLDRVVEELRRPAGGTGQSVDGIMRLVAREPVPRRPLLPRLRAWSGATPAWRLVGAGGLAAAVIAIAVGLARTGSPRPRSTAQLDGAGPGREVRFALSIPEAREVVLVGDFNGWNPAGTALARSPSDGRWSVTLTLRPGHYHYLFLVDGRRWLADPSMPREPHADFGSPDSIITVL
jgi:hypothetical protein